MVDLQGKRQESLSVVTFRMFTRMSFRLPCIEGWPVECWDVSTAFLYARLFGDRDTDLGGNEIYMRPPRILVETNVVAEGVIWKIKKALYGWRTSPIAWETESQKPSMGA